MNKHAHIKSSKLPWTLCVSSLGKVVILQRQRIVSGLMFRADCDDIIYRDSDYDLVSEVSLPYCDRVVYNK